MPAQDDKARRFLEMDVRASPSAFAASGTQSSAMSNSKTLEAAKDAEYPSDEELNFDVHRIIAVSKMENEGFAVEVMRNNANLKFAQKNKDLFALAEFWCEKDPSIFDIRFVHKGRLIPLCESQNNVWQLCEKNRIWVFLNNVKYLVDYNNEMNSYGSKAFKQKDFAKALTYYNKCIDRSPMNLRAISNRSITLMKLERYVDSIHEVSTMLTTCQSLKSANSFSAADESLITKCYFRLGRCFFHLAEEALTEARKESIRDSDDEVMDTVQHQQLPSKSALDDLDEQVIAITPLDLSTYSSCPYLKRAVRFFYQSCVNFAKVPQEMKQLEVDAEMAISINQLVIRGFNPGVCSLCHKLTGVIASISAIPEALIPEIVPTKFLDPELEKQARISKLKQASDHLLKSAQFPLLCEECHKYVKKTENNFVENLWRPFYKHPNSDLTINHGDMSWLCTIILSTSFKHLATQDFWHLGYFDKNNVSIRKKFYHLRTNLNHVMNNTQPEPDKDMRFFLITNSTTTIPDQPALSYFLQDIPCAMLQQFDIHQRDYLSMVYTKLGHFHLIGMLKHQAADQYNQYQEHYDVTNFLTEGKSLRLQKSFTVAKNADRDLPAPLLAFLQSEVTSS